MVKRIVIDLDDTLSSKADGESYDKALPKQAVINQLKRYQSLGYTVCIFTARNMRTFDGNVGKINAITLPVIIDWLQKYQVPYDEIIVGKPWCGHDGFYVDDRAIRPSEFVELDHDQIENLLKKK